MYCNLKQNLIILYFIKKKLLLNFPFIFYMQMKFSIYTGTDSHINIYTKIDKDIEILLIKSLHLKPIF